MRLKRTGTVAHRSVTSFSADLASLLKSKYCVGPLDADPNVGKRDQTVTGRRWSRQRGGGRMGSSVSQARSHRPGRRQRLALVRSGRFGIWIDRYRRSAWNHNGGDGPCAESSCIPARSSASRCRCSGVTLATKLESGGRRPGGRSPSAVTLAQCSRYSDHLSSVVFGLLIGRAIPCLICRIPVSQTQSESSSPYEKPWRGIIQYCLYSYSASFSFPQLRQQWTRRYTSTMCRSLFVPFWDRFSCCLGGCVAWEPSWS
jgi:hypothetical protein